MRSVIAWALAGAMLAASAWLLWPTRPEQAADPVALTQEAAPAPADPAAKQRTLRKAGLPRLARAGGASAGSDPLPAPARPAPTGGAREPADPGRDPVDRRTQGSGSGRANTSAGSSAEGPGEAADRIVRREGETEALESADSRDPFDSGATPSQEEAPARCALRLGLWSEAEIEARTRSRMRRSGVDHDAARRQVLALLAVGYERAVAQLGQDAPPGALKARADQISFLAASLPPDSYADLLEQAGHC